jgi:hypothetical protein
VAGPWRAGGGGRRCWSGRFLGRDREAAGGCEAPASTGETFRGISAGNGGLDMAAHGDPEFTGGTVWEVEAKGARSGFGKRISEANEVVGSCWCY